MAEGTFVVVEADAETAVLRDVADARVHAVGDHPDLAVGEVVEATLEPDPPLELSWTVAELHDRRTVTVEAVAEPPTRQARELAPEAVGGLATTERAGEGELHVLRVAPEDTASAVEDVLEDRATLARAARLGVGRVEVRSADGVVAVRYLP